ncbi:MAG TPA: HipA family kinase [Thermomicrobiales bacterium]
MIVKRLIGLRYLVPLREGGSLPAIVETDEPGAYVVKFRGAGQGVKALVAELLAAELALLLGLPVPAPAVVALDAGFGQAEPDPEIQDILRGSSGANFGLAYLAGALAFDPAADRITDPDLAAAIVWFDAYITNVDRTARNTNLLRWNGSLYLIDHGASLYFHHRSEGWERSAQARFPHIKDHVLLPFAGDVAAAGERLAPLLTEAAIRAVVAAIPDEWLTDEGRFVSPAAYREAYVAYFLARLVGPRPFEEEARDAAAALRLV